MARPEKIPLEVPAAVGVGAASSVFRFREKTVQVAGAFVASLALEGSIDGTNYVAVGAAITAPALVSVPYTIEFLRVRVTAFTSGQPVVTAAGFDFRAM